MRNDGVEINSSSLNLATKVIVAGRTMFLPNKEVPIVVQKLTMGQIKAIPKNRFAVSLIDAPAPRVMTAPGHRGGGTTSRREVQKIRRLVRQLSGGNAMRLIPGSFSVIPEEDDGTKLYTAIIAKVDEIKENATNLYYANRKLSRNQGGDPPDDNLFYEPIDEGKMSDCIMKVITGFFVDNNKCKIHGREYKLAEFCLLIHIYFLRIGILKNETHKPFCEYLLKSVLKDKKKFTPRTFNNYAKEHEDEEKEFTDKKRLEIDFRYRPKPSNRPFLDAFHEIGFVFHHSDYFSELRDLRKRMNSFVF